MEGASICRGDVCSGLSASGGGDTAQTVSSALHQLCRSLQAATHFSSLASHSQGGFISERILTSLLPQSRRPPAHPLPSGRQLRGGERRWVLLRTLTVPSPGAPGPRSQCGNPAGVAGTDPSPFLTHASRTRRETALTWRTAQDNDPVAAVGRWSTPTLPTKWDLCWPTLHAPGGCRTLPTSRPTLSI